MQVSKDQSIGLYVPRLGRLFIAILGLALLIVASVGCGPPSSSGGDTGPASSGAIPEITEEMIHQRINDVRVRDIPSENSTTKPIVWNFDEDEPKEITVIEKKVDGNRATILLDIKTGSSPRSPVQRRVAGQLRTEWALQTGWVLRRWEIIRTENISMKYHDLTPPPAPPQIPGAANQESTR